MAKKKATGRQEIQKKLSGKLEARYEKRRAAVDAVRAGEPISVVARVMKVSPRALFKWLERYRHGGYHALREGHRSGRKRKVDAELMRWLYEAITKHDPRQYEFPFSLWTLGWVRLLLKRKFGVEMSKSAISRLLRHLGLSPTTADLSELQAQSTQDEGISRADLSRAAGASPAHRRDDILCR